MAALDLLGSRWALRVLSAAALVERGEDESYALTALGVDLGTALAPLSRWAARWGDQLQP